MFRENKRLLIVSLKRKASIDTQIAVKNIAVKVLFFEIKKLECFISHPKEFRLAYWSIPDMVATEEWNVLKSFDLIN